MPRLMPVSYTHLDVYKRQTLHLRETKYMPVTDVNSKRKNTANISAVSLGIQLIRIIITVMMTVILIR